MLNWVFGGAAVTQPANWSVALATAAPNSTSAFEVPTGIGLNRAPITWPAAAAAGTVSNTATVSFGSATGAVTISGVTIWNTSGSVGGSAIAYGTLAAARAMQSGDSLTFPPAAITVSLV
jgi:hypothetical protein